MHRKAVFDSCRRAAFATVTVSARSKGTTTVPHGTSTCMPRIVPIGGAGPLPSKSSTLIDGDVRKNRKIKKSHANATRPTADDGTPVVELSKVDSQVADVSGVETPLPVDPQALTGAQFPKRPVDEGSASGSEIYSQFAKSSSRTTGVHRKNNRDHPHQTKYYTRNHGFVTLGPRLEIPITNHGARMKHVLPTLNASALFQAQPDDNDTRQELLHVMREETMRKRRRPFIMTGHGVPPQLLQDHLQMADSLLRQENATECSFNNYFDQLTLHSMYVK